MLRSGRGGSALWSSRRGSVLSAFGFCVGGSRRGFLCRFILHSSILDNLISLDAVLIFDRVDGSIDIFVRGACDEEAVFNDGL